MNFALASADIYPDGWGISKHLTIKGNLLKPTRCRIRAYALPETNSSHLKIDDWRQSLSFENGPFTKGALAVSFTRV